MFWPDFVSKSAGVMHKTALSGSESLWFQGPSSILGPLSYERALKIQLSFRNLLKEPFIRFSTGSGLVVAAEEGGVVEGSIDGSSDKF